MDQYKFHKSTKAHIFKTQECKMIFAPLAKLQGLKGRVSRWLSPYQIYVIIPHNSSRLMQDTACVNFPRTFV